MIEPDDPTKAMNCLEPEYHGDTNADEGEGRLSYRTYGRYLEEKLVEIGFDAEYSGRNVSENGIMNTEPYFSRKICE